MLAHPTAAHLFLNNTNPNKFSLLSSPKGEGQDEGIHITTFWDWYNIIVEINAGKNHETNTIRFYAN